MSNVSVPNTVIYLCPVNGCKFKVQQDGYVTDGETLKAKISARYEGSVPEAVAGVVADEFSAMLSVLERALSTHAESHSPVEFLHTIRDQATDIRELREQLADRTSYADQGWITASKTLSVLEAIGNGSIPANIAAAEARRAAQEARQYAEQDHRKVGA